MGVYYYSYLETFKDQNFPTEYNPIRLELSVYQKREHTDVWCTHQSSYRRYAGSDFPPGTIVDGGENVFVPVDRELELIKRIYRV